MASSGSRRNDDPERARRVRSDAAHKCAARRYTRWGLTPPPSLLRRKTEEYDRARGRLISGSSSFEASSSRLSSSLPPVKRELEELPLVKMEPEAKAGPERRAGAVVGPEDFLPPMEADSLLPVLHEVHERRKNTSSVTGGRRRSTSCSATATTDLP
ncbi:putative ATP-dependent helicase C23E6.02 [Hordeum vulgare]|nr:putative ATP-dependent helicase C23E6.02 [Hordeum vulgare]